MLGLPFQLINNNQIIIAWFLRNQQIYLIKVCFTCLHSCYLCPLIRLILIIDWNRSSLTWTECFLINLQRLWRCNFTNIALSFGLTYFISRCSSHLLLILWYTNKIIFVLNNRIILIRLLLNYLIYFNYVSLLIGNILENSTK